MTREQAEKFAVGYPVLTDCVVVLLDKYNDDINKVHEILCRNQNEIAIEVQKAIIEYMGVYNG